MKNPSGIPGGFFICPMGGFLMENYFLTGVVVAIGFADVIAFLVLAGFAVVIGLVVVIGFVVVIEFDF
jgi:hypothetical protein